MTVSIMKSGANLHLSASCITYDGLGAGRNNAIGINQAALGNSFPCFQVIVQADLANTANIFIGNLTQGCYYELAAGNAVTLPINNIEKIYVRSAAGVQAANWLAMF